MFLTLDEDAIGRDNSANFPEIVEQSFVNSNLKASVLHEKSCHTELEVHGSTNFKKVIDRIGTLLSEIRNVCFDVTSIDSLISAELTLKDMLKSLLKSCDHDAGLRLSGNNIKRSLAIKRKPSYVCDQLPRKYSKPNPFALRVGEAANKMKPLYRVKGLPPLIPEISRRAADKNYENEKSETIVTADSIKNFGIDKKSDSQFTPSIHFVRSSHLDKNLLKNGPHAVSLLQLKSLEPVLPETDLMLLKACDKQFNIGWLYDEIINGYLWRICKENTKCLYVSSMNVLVLEKGGSVKKMWENMDLQDKELIFMPWNPSGLH